MASIGPTSATASDGPAVDGGALQVGDGEPIAEYRRESGGRTVVVTARTVLARGSAGW